MQKMVVLVATIGALLTGCMFGPDYQRPALPVPAQHRDAEPSAPGQEAVSLADLQWFALFQDERLQALVATALQNNYDVRIAAARVLEAAAQLGVTRSFLLPTVDGTAEVGRDRVSQENFIPIPPGVSSVGNTFALGLALTWEVDVWGRIRRQTESARADLLAAEWARRAVLVTVISQVASAYFALRELDDELAIAQRTLASRQKSLTLTQLRLEHGASTRLDVRQAETLLYTAA
ncbi:MAG TPA: TolC family protein, partial [Candidatus Tectomicrobia bacterium]